MARPLSLKLRIGLWVGLMVTVVWIGAAVVTVRLLFHEVNEIFDRDLRATAERILPIVIHEHEEEGRAFGGKSKDIERMRDHQDDVEFTVTSGRTGLVLRSEGAAEISFPSVEGFHSNATYRFYVDHAKRGDLTIAVARPLATRRALAVAATGALSLPLLVVIPLTLLGIYAVVRRGLKPLVTLETEMERRGPDNLAPIALGDLPRELGPMVEATNTLMARVEAGFEAERSFAANAAHEMRTPVAGAMAQAQRLQRESGDPSVVARASEIVATLKRLNRYSEKLMQMARAEGARMRQDGTMDLRAVVEIIVQDFERSEVGHRIDLELPAAPVPSDLDPDGFGIVLRNLIENALRHGAADQPVTVRLSADRCLSVANAGPVLPPEQLTRLSGRFMRGDGAGNGTGLGLSIVQIIAERSGATLTLVSPRPEAADGVEVRFRF